jgi:hypothetical protein
MISKQVVPARRQPRTACTSKLNELVFNARPSTTAGTSASQYFTVLSPNGRLSDYATFFTLFMVDYDNLEFTLLISASSRTFSRRQSAAIELFTAAATFSVLIHLLSQVRGGISQDSGTKSTD